MDAMWYSLICLSSMLVSKYTCHNSVWPHPLRGLMSWALLHFSVCGLLREEGFCFLCSIEGGAWRCRIPHAPRAVYSFRMPLVCAGCRDRCANISHAEVAVKSIGGITCHSFTIQCVACVAKVYSALPTPLHA